MDARPLYRTERLHGTRQFALERPLEIDLFHELAGADPLVLEQFEADRATARQALLGQPQPGFIDAIGGNEDRASPFGHAVGHVDLLEGGDDRAAVAIGDVAEQHLVVGHARP